MVAEPELVDHPGGDVVRDDVAVLDHVVGQVDRFALAEVEEDAALALVVLVEVAGATGVGFVVGEGRDQPSDARRTCHRLDADHLGAEVGQILRTERARPHLCEVQHP